MSLRLGWVVLTVALSACATTERVVLLPDDVSGKVGKIHVAGRDGGEVLLDSAYGEARSSGGGVTSGTADQEALRKEFAAELANLPERPQSYQLYFINDSDQLTDESRALLPAILKEVARRPAPEVVVIGHTDRVGTTEHNDKLSLARAQVVREQLAAQGIDPARIEVAGRGSREPLVPTADQMAEPRNRRVEVEVR